MLLPDEYEYLSDYETGESEEADSIGVEVIRDETGNAYISILHLVQESCISSLTVDVTGARAILKLLQDAISQADNGISKH